MAYEWHVFLSYRRAPPVSRWLHTHFRGLLEEWLSEAEVDWQAATGLDSVRVFNDQDYIAPGDVWPDELREALAASCLLVPIWSPRYFQSRWCMAELASMRARQQALSAGGPGPRLIFPIRFTDGVPDSLKGIQYADFDKLNQSVDAFRQTGDYVAFEQRVRAFADTLAAALRTIPPWTPDWPPVELPDVARPPGFALPGLA